jgi:predicted MFS family arabinose efflux permease
VSTRDILTEHTVAPQAWRLAVGGLIAMASAIGIGRFIYTPILPPMAESLHLSKGAAGLIASANFIGYLVGALAAASSRIRGDLRAWLLGALAISAVTTGMMAWPDDMATILALRFVGGTASAYVLVLASALVLDRLNAANKGSLSAVHFSGVGIGITASALLTWLLASIGAGWQAMWIGGGLLSLAGLVAAALLIPGAQSARVPNPATLDDIGDLRLNLLTVAYGLFGFGYVITITFIVVIVRGSPPALAVEPVFWLALGLAAVPSVAFWVAAARRVGVMRAYAAAALVEAMGVYASVAWPTVAGLLAASVLLGATFMGLTALGLIGARDLAPANPRRWLAILTSAFGFGQIVGPIVAGYGFDLTGSFFLPSMLAVAALCISAFLALAVSRQRSKA